MLAITLTVLSLFISPITAPAADEDAPAGANASPQLQRYSFTGTFQKGKWSRNLDAVVLAGENAANSVFIGTVAALQGKKQSISPSLMECIGDPVQPYDGPVEIVASIARVSGGWITLRIQDAVCQRLLN